MQCYIARQPIFDQHMNVLAYELLYRAGSENVANVTDGDAATRSLLSDAMMVFGLNNLTNGRMAYVNFTEHLLMSDFVLMADPRQVVIEVLERTQVSDRLIGRLKKLKAMGYHLALDDYVGNPTFDPILQLMNVIKVDFLQTTQETQEKIAKKHRYNRNISLLAEKVEDRETFERARRWGYKQFQGYFFARATPISKTIPDINAATYVRLLRELNEPDVDLFGCSEIIRTDPVLTYHLLKKVNTMQYYRGNSVKAISQMVAYLGIDELYHWVILTMARDVNRTYSDETVREAYLRGIFMERLMKNSPYSKKNLAGFLLGIFSMMDQIMDDQFANILDGIMLPQEVLDILLHDKDNELRQYLEFAKEYEKNQATTLPELNMDQNQVVNLYMKCMKETDWAFRGA